MEGSGSSSPSFSDYSDFPYKDSTTGFDLLTDTTTRIEEITTNPSTETIVKEAIAPGISERDLLVSVTFFGGFVSGIICLIVVAVIVRNCYPSEYNRPKLNDILSGIFKNNSLCAIVTRFNFLDLLIVFPMLSKSNKRKSSYLINLI